jgi:hypothetical protein
LGIGAGTMAHFAKGVTVKLSTDGRNNVEVSDEPFI